MSAAFWRNLNLKPRHKMPTKRNARRNSSNALEEEVLELLGGLAAKNTFHTANGENKITGMYVVCM